MAAIPVLGTGCRCRRSVEPAVQPVWLKCEAPGPVRDPFSKPKVESDEGRLPASASGCHMDTPVHVCTHKHVHTNTYTQTHKGRKSQLWWYQTSYGNYHDGSTHATEMGGPLSHCHWWSNPQALWAQRGHIWPLAVLFPPSLSQGSVQHEAGDSLYGNCPLMSSFASVLCGNTFISHREVFRGCVDSATIAFRLLWVFFFSLSLFLFFFSTTMRNDCVQFSILLKFSFFLEQHLSLRSLFRTVTRCSCQHPPTLPLHSAGVKSN